jgi:hypothetical protein
VGANVAGPEKPEGFQLVNSANANGFPCDIYSNIFTDPLLVNSFGGNFRLTEGSPAIDAGDLNLPIDPDLTTADIGALYFPQFNSIANPREVKFDKYKLFLPYPNPFNSSTKITFLISNSSKVSLTIYNILGREAANLVNGNLPAGQHAYEFDASQFASGVYIAVLETDGYREMKKLILVK